MTTRQQPAPWMLELLVPATRAQLAACEDQALYDELADPRSPSRSSTN